MAARSLIEATRAQIMSPLGLQYDHLAPRFARSACEMLCDGGELSRQRCRNVVFGKLVRSKRAAARVPCEGCAWWVCSVTWGYGSPGTDVEKGCRILELTETARVAAGSSQDKARDLFRERYSAYISAGADYDSKWNHSVGNDFWGSEEVCAREPVER
jgi:hypothetical protein